MKRFLCLMLVTSMVGAASAEWYTAYLHDFDSTDGITVREGDPNNPCTGPYLDEGGVWGDCGWDYSGYGVMDIDLDPVNGINTDSPLDFSYGEITVSLQWTSDFYIPDATVGCWLRFYSRKWNDDTQAWEFSGSRNFFADVVQGPPGGPPGWQTFTFGVDDWNEDNGWGPFDPTQVYKLRYDAIVWDISLSPWSWGIDMLEFRVPECPLSLDEDDDVDLADLAELLAHYGCEPHSAIPHWSTDFENYNLGDLPGQDLWVDDTSGEYGFVQVVEDPTGAGMGKVIMLDPPGTEGGWLGAARAVDPPPSGQYIVMEWDQYRTDLNDNFWYADGIAWDGWWAMQWDQNHQASSMVYDFGAPVAEEVWEHVTYLFDTVNQTATVAIGDVIYTGPTAMTDAVINGVDFEVEPTEAGGEDGPLYIDNVVLGTVPNLEYLFGCEAAHGDYDGDRDVDLSDLAELLGEYGCGT